MTGHDLPTILVHVLDPISLVERASLRDRHAPGSPCSDATVLCCAAAVREMQRVDAGAQHEFVVVGSMREERLLARFGIGTTNRVNRSVVARSLRRFLRDRFDSADSCVVCCWSSASLYSIANELSDVRTIGIVLDDAGLNRESLAVYLDPPVVGVPDALPSCAGVLGSMAETRDWLKAEWRADNEIPDGACVIALLGAHAHTEPAFQFAMLLGRLAACDCRVVGAARFAPEPAARVRRFERASGARCTVINEPSQTVVDQLICADIAVAMDSLGSVPVAHEVSIALAMGVPIVTGRGVVPASVLPEAYRRSVVALANDPSAMAHPLLKLLDDMAQCQPLIDAGKKHDPSRDERFAATVLALAHEATPMRV